MTPLLFALALVMAENPATAAPAAPAAEAPAPGAIPVGAPSDDYQFVGWCYGELRGYLDLHDKVMPDVTRIESTYRAPGSNLAADLKVYADQQRQGQSDLKRFQAAMTAAEKASLRPINTDGAAAIRKGMSVWNAGPDVTTRRLAQDWMSWTLPARCQTTAKTLEQRALLMGPALKANMPQDAAPAPAADAPAPAPADAPPADAPKSN